MPLLLDYMIRPSFFNETSKISEFEAKFNNLSVRASRNRDPKISLGQLIERMQSQLSAFTDNSAAPGTTKTTPDK